MRFPASSHTRERGPSITASVTSSPRWAGRQWRKMASGEARSISAVSTWNGSKACSRRSESASPMLTQVSVTTASAPSTASTLSWPMVTREPTSARARSIRSGW